MTNETPLLRTSRHGEVYLTALRKDSTGETYSLLWTQATASEALRTLGRWAVNPELSFSWFDAAVMSQKISSQGAG